jgi:hypothetical protein
MITSTAAKLTVGGVITEASGGLSLTKYGAGTWGAIGSGATHQSAFFTGTGMLNITTGSIVIPTQTAAILAITNIGSGKFDLTLQGTPGAEYQVVASGVVTAAMSTWTPVIGSTFAPDLSGQWTSTVTNTAPQFYRLKAVNPAP